MMHRCVWQARSRNLWLGFGDDDACPTRHREASGEMPLLTAGFRPLFLTAGVWSVIARPWIAVLNGVFALPSRFDPLRWHIHEMIYDFVMAAVGGLLLTAMTDRTGQPPVTGVALATLSVLWIAGRAVCLVSAWFAAWGGVVVALAFPAGLTLGRPRNGA